MKTKITILALICVLLLAACGGVTPYPSQIEPSPIFASSATAFPEITITPTPTAIPGAVPTPKTLYGYPTPDFAVLPTCGPAGECMQLTPDVQIQDLAFPELYVGKYVLRNWCNRDPRFTFLSFCAVTISSNDMQQFEIWGYPALFGNETGADLTGQGKSDIVIINYSGGNCCVNVTMYEAGDNLKKIMDIGSFRVGTFTDLNGDETYEYIAPYRNFSLYCMRCTLRTSVVFEYQVDSGYLPATDKFKEVLSADIQWTSDFVAQFTRQNPNMSFHFLSNEYDKNPTSADEEFMKFDQENPDYSRAVNALYQLVAYYLLSGQQADAQQTLDRYFPPNKAAEYMSAIQQDLHGLLAP